MHEVYHLYCLDKLPEIYQITLMVPVNENPKILIHLIIQNLSGVSKLTDHNKCYETQ
jgi:hypothetical protein